MILERMLMSESVADDGGGSRHLEERSDETSKDSNYNIYYYIYIPYTGY